MPDPISVQFEDVTKIYRLYNHLVDQALDVFGLSWLQFWKKTKYAEFPALSGINLEIKKGERVGIVGRNGAGKTTMLKLITNNFAQTSGEITVCGSVQALMSTGLGFHFEFSGYENIRSALVYNGLPKEETHQAIEEIIDFVELGQFLHQPVKNYSKGMLARLQFAVSTAVLPDILIIDEVLGAGDAYFSAKSADRMHELANSGCTLLIVSHSMAQILQFCDRVVWLEEGRIIEDGEPLPIIKAYERFSFEKRQTLHQSKGIRESQESIRKDRLLISSGGDQDISRWEQEDTPIMISRVRLLDQNGNENSYFEHGSRMTIEIEIQASEQGNFPCRFACLFFNSSAVNVTWHLSDYFDFNFNIHEKKKVCLTFDNILFTGDEYMISIGAFKEYDPLDKTKAKRYDLISRSFNFQVGNDLSGTPALIHHPANWDVL